MILNRSASILHLYRLSSPPELLFHLRRSYLSLTSSKSSSPSIICSFWFNESRTRQFTSSAVAPAADKRGSDTFYADERVSWTSLGLSDPISRAMSNAGFERPSLVQAASVPLILSGKDVIIAAETGSGKTHGYLVPLFERICTGPDCIENTTGQEYAPPHKFALVLCPNVLLCEQVVRMANGLCGDNGEPLLRAAAVGGRQGWPVQEPDVIVSTPVALLNNIEPNKRHFLHFMRAVKYVVFDEADMLLCGGYQNKVIRLINLLRHSEKKLSQMNTSVLESPVESNSESLSHFDWEDKEVIGNDMDEEHSESDSEVESLAVETETSSIKKMDWKRVRKHYERSKQYIFVAATLPVNGKKTAGAVLKRMFPDAKWVNGNFVHRHNPRLKERWVEVTFDTQVDALMEAVNKKYVSEGHYDGADSRCTMVFANTVEAVEAVAKILQSSGIKCYRYHKDSSLEERAKVLVDFQEKGGVLVCTDAAARGIDIPNVSHIIQADFATSAVDFLHRVGRTARAGQYGLVTSLYTEANRELVDAIRQAWELGQPVETAFSRKRSFRNKLKKRGLSKVKDMSNTELAMA